jgi:hypothetical protein
MTPKLSVRKHGATMAGSHAANSAKVSAWPSAAAANSDFDPRAQFDHAVGRQAEI